MKGNNKGPVRFSRRTKAVVAAVSLVALYFFCTRVLFIAARVDGSYTFQYQMIMCVFKSVASTERYSKSGAVFSSVSQVFASEPDGGAGWMSSSFPTDKLSGHESYVPLYDKLLTEYVAQEGINVLEIGVKKGGFTKVLRELFPQSATIYGLDLDPGVPTFSRDAGMKVVAGLDSTKCEAVQRAFRGIEFDLVIDDGLHHSWAIYKTFSCLKAQLKEDGLYVAEDVHAFDRRLFLQMGYRTQVYPLEKQSGQGLVAIFPSKSKAMQHCCDAMPAA